MNLDHAVIAHSIWKSKFRTAILNADSMDAEMIGDDTCCELGVWLHGEGGRQYGTKPDFISLVAKHKAFHDEAGEIAATINAKKYSEANVMISSLSAFGSASVAVTVGIARLKQSLV